MKTIYYTAHPRWRMHPYSEGNMGLFYEPSTSITTKSVRRAAPASQIDLDELAASMDDALMSMPVDNADERRERTHDLMRRLGVKETKPEQVEQKVETKGDPKWGNIWKALGLLLVVLVAAGVMERTGFLPKSQEALLSVLKSGLLGVFALLGVETAKNG
jgi:hypothetical protein